MEVAGPNADKMGQGGSDGAVVLIPLSAAILLKENDRWIIIAKAVVFPSLGAKDIPDETSHRRGGKEQHRETPSQEQHHEVSSEEQRHERHSQEQHHERHSQEQHHERFSQEQHRPREDEEREPGDPMEQ